MSVFKYNKNGVDYIYDTVHNCLSGNPRIDYQQNIKKGSLHQ